MYDLRRCQSVYREHKITYVQCDHGNCISPWSEFELSNREMRGNFQFSQVKYFSERRNSPSLWNLTTLILNRNIYHTSSDLCRFKNIQACIAENTFQAVIFVFLSTVAPEITYLIPIAFLARSSKTENTMKLTRADFLSVFRCFVGLHLRVCNLLNK